MPAMEKIWVLLLVVPVLASCDYAETNVQTGQQAADSAREIVTTDADRQINQARELIKLGKTDDARRILLAVQESEASLSESSKEKLAAALEELESR